MNDESNSNYYMGSFIVSLIGGIMVLVGEFGGWYIYEGGYTSNYQEWGYVHTYNGPWVIILGPVAAAMLYVAYLSYNATRTPPDIEQIDLMYKISRAALIAILAGALLFVILVSENDDWWFSEGFYGGAVGSLISTLLLKNAKDA